MGADLVMEFIVLPENGYDTKEMKAAAYAAIQETTTVDYSTIVNSTANYQKKENENDDDYLTRLQTLARGFVDSLIAVLDNKHSGDVCNYLTIAGFEIWASGGMMDWNENLSATTRTFVNANLLPDKVKIAIGIPLDISTPYGAFMYHINMNRGNTLPIPIHLRDELKKWYDQINLAKEL